MLWGPFQDCCCQLPNCLASLLTHTSMRGPPILAGSLVQSSMGSLLFSPGCWCMWDFICALQGWTLFLPVPLLDPQAGKPDMGLRTFTSGRTSFMLLFSNLWITHLAGMGFYFIVIVPLLSSCYGFFFVFGHRVSLFGGFQCPHVNDCSTDSSNSGALAGGDEHTFFYSSILNWKSCVSSS